jgi:hypothetical protein
MMREYTVSVACNFEADDPLDALRQMVAWLDDARYQAGYRVTSETGDSIFIDAEEIDI